MFILKTTTEDGDHASFSGSDSISLKKIVDMFYGEGTFPPSPATTYLVAAGAASQGASCTTARCTPDEPDARPPPPPLRMDATCLSHQTNNQQRKCWPRPRWRTFSPTSTCRSSRSTRRVGRVGLWCAAGAARGAHCGTHATCMTRPSIAATTPALHTNARDKQTGPLHGPGVWRQGAGAYVLILLRCRLTLGPCLAHSNPFPVRP